MCDDLLSLWKRGGTWTGTDSLLAVHHPHLPYEVFKQVRGCYQTVCCDFDGETRTFQDCKHFCLEIPHECKLKISNHRDAQQSSIQVKKQLHHLGWVDPKET